MGCCESALSMCRQKKDGNPASPVAVVVPKVTFQEPPVTNPVVVNARTSPEPDERKSGTPPLTPVPSKHAQRPTLSMPPGDSSPWSVVD
mgnify:CR=1 FL=1